MYIYIYTHITESLCCTIEINTTLQINYTSKTKKVHHNLPGESGTIILLSLTKSAQASLDIRGSKSLLMLIPVWTPHHQFSHQSSFYPPYIPGLKHLRESWSHPSDVTLISSYLLRHLYSCRAGGTVAPNPGGHSHWILREWFTLLYVTWWPPVNSKRKGQGLGCQVFSLSWKLKDL